MLPELQRFRAAERWIVKKLRTWLDRADEVVHTYEIRLRSESESFAGVETNRQVTESERSGRLTSTPAKRAASLSHVRAHRAKRRMTAAEFDADMRRRIDARLELAR